MEVGFYLFFVCYYNIACFIKRLIVNKIQSDQQETKSRVLPHLLFYRNVFLSWISRFYLLAVDTRFVGCLPLKNLSLIAFINFL
jgi:hypothetical protein